MTLFFVQSWQVGNWVLPFVGEDACVRYTSRVPKNLRKEQFKLIVPDGWVRIVYLSNEKSLAFFFKKNAQSKTNKFKLPSL